MWKIEKKKKEIFSFVEKYFIEVIVKFSKKAYFIFDNQ